MKRFAITMLLLSVCVGSFALSGLYYILRDAEGYIVDITSKTGDTAYTRIDFAVEIPADILCGCYKYTDGQFVRDEEKYALWLASRQPQLETTPDAIGGGE